MTSYATHYARRRAEASKTGDAGITCLMTEFPSNPLLNIPDLLKLRKLADRNTFEEPGAAGQDDDKAKSKGRGGKKKSKA